MTAKRLIPAFFFVTTAGFLLVACSSATKHRVLTFFFDGVPEMGAEPVVRNANATGTTPLNSELGEASQSSSPRRIVYTHPPFAQGKCTACHSLTTGSLMRSTQEGLCNTCHNAVTSEKVYLHGPVAVGDCLACHHPHQSPFPGVLLADVNDMCFRCHDSDDLTEGDYHQLVEGQRCNACHDPHGGDDRFFLQRRTP